MRGGCVYIIETIIKAMKTEVIATKEFYGDKYELVKTTGTCGVFFQTLCNGVVVSKVYERLSQEIKDFFTL